MKNKKGFTLIELLGVIVILVMVVLIAVPSIMGITKIVKKNMLDKKLKVIKQAAVMYGSEHEEEILNSGLKCDGKPCKKILVSDLVPDYLNKDNKNECLEMGSSNNQGCVVDPSNKNNYLDKNQIIIYAKNNRIYSSINNNVNVNDITLADYLLYHAIDTKGLNKTTLEGGMYRYQGNNDSDDGNGGTIENDGVHNYICFGTSDKNTCTGSPETYMYRIIGINENNEVKLIKMTSIVRHRVWNKNYSDDIPWPNSDLKKDLNWTFFLTNPTYVPNDTWKNMIKDTEWKYGDIAYADGNKVVEEIYKIESGDSATPGYWTKPETAEEKEAATAKIGLMYLHDYYYSGKSGGHNCRYDASPSEYAECKESWMHLSNNQTTNQWEWTMSRVSLRGSYYYAWSVDYIGYLSNDYVNNAGGARPVFYLTSSTVYKSGTGKVDNPIIIEAGS